MTRYALAIDLDRCTACQACVVACKMENNVPVSTPETFRNRKMTLRSRVVPLTREGQYPNASVGIYPVLCNQCDNPACVAACPTAATYKRQDGIVLIDWDKCIGCKYCMAACPYNARSYVEEEQPAREYQNPDLAAFYKASAPPKGKVDKCTFCAHLVDKGQQPACVTACPAEARVFGDLNDPQSAVSQLLASRRNTVMRPEFKTKPMVHYLT